MNEPCILFVDHTGALGGAELYLLDVARHFRDRATVLLFDDGPFRQRLSEDGVDVEVVSAPTSLHSVGKQSSPLQALQGLPALFRIAAQVAERGSRYDVIYANSQKALLACSIARLWARTPLIWNLHDLLTEEHFSRVNRWVAVGCANVFADYVVCNSQASLQAFRNQGGTSPGRVVYNGIDPNPFSLDEPKSSSSPVRPELGLSPDASVVGVFSRLAPWKGQHVVLQALTDLPNVHAVLVGGALFEADVSYEDRLHKQADELGVKDRVHFLGFRDDIPALMQAVDAVVHSSVSAEPFGRVIVEGMLAGTPVVATRAGGAVEIITNMETGLLVEPGNPRALRDALREVLNNSPLNRTITQAARSEATRRFSSSKMLSGVESAIDTVLSKR